jgi:hypothetical protein
MEKEFIPHKESLELKKLGFDEECIAYYKDGEFKVWSIFDPYKNSEMKSWFIASPLYQQAFDWFRINHKMNCRINYWHKDAINTEYWFEISYIYNKCSHSTSSIAENLYNLTYKEARLECIKQLIKIVKNDSETILRQ